MMYGFLVNLNLFSEPNILINIASRFSNIHNIIKNFINNLSSSDISERTVINFCKNLKKENIDIFASNFKNNFLYFYFPSLIKKEQENLDNIINNKINEKGKDFIPLATSFAIECKKPKSLLSYFNEKIKKREEHTFQFGELLRYSLEIRCKYSKELKNEINKTIELAEKENYKSIFWPLRIFVKYLNILNKTFQNIPENINETLIKQNVNISYIRFLNLCEKLNMNNLFSWDYIDLLSEKNIFIFDLITNLHKKLDISSLHEFFKEITNNIILINEILNVFPNSKFQETRFSLINNIMTYIIKSAANKQINFIIKIEDQNYYFKFIEKENEKINLTLDLNMDNNQLIIIKKTIIMLPSINKEKPFDGTNKIKKESLNNYYLILIEKIMNSEKFDTAEFRSIYKEVLCKIDNNINEEIKEKRFNVFFKNNSNLVNYIWSILFLEYIKFNEEYLLYFLNNEKSNLEKDIYITFCNLYNQITNNNNQNNNDIEKIVNFTTALSRIVDSNTILYNLSYDKKYIINQDFKSIDKTKNIKQDIQKELDNIEYFISIFKEFAKIFQPYAALLSDEISLLKHKINEMEIDDYKTKIKKKNRRKF